MERKLNKKRVIIVAALAFVFLMIVGICIAVLASHGKDKKQPNQPILCEEPAFPATLAAAGGTYTRKLSTYWWVNDVKNGKVILEDVNRFHGGNDPEDDLGVVDLQGRVIIACDNREVHFTNNGYIATWHHENGKSTFNYFNMGGNCLASLEARDDESNKKYEGDPRNKETETYKITDKIDGSVKYYGKYAVISQFDSRDKNKKMNTCVYEFKAA